MYQEITIKEKCPRCGKNAIVTDEETGEVICVRCGFVLYERLADSGPEWRSFLTEKTNKARTGQGASLAMHDQGLATVIGSENSDSVGKPLSSTMKIAIARLRVWDSRSQFHGSIDRNYRLAFNELDRMKDKLVLSNAVIEKAAYLYRKAMDKNLIRGRSISVLIGASLYAACRDAGTPRTLKDFAKAANIRKRNLAVCYRLLVKELDLKMPVVDSVQCIARIASILGISEKTKRSAVQLLKKARENRILDGKDPMSMAASALYISCVDEEDNFTQKEIARAADVTEVTIRNRYKGLKKVLEN